MAKGKRGAPRGNKNHVVPEEKRKRGTSTQVSLDYDTWERFKEAADAHEGRALTEEEHKELWRGLCRGAIRSFVDRHYPYGDPAIIV